MSDERVDAGGGRVPEDWHGPVSEQGHDRSGRRQRRLHSEAEPQVSVTDTLQAGSGPYVYLPENVTLEPRGEQGEED